MQPSSQATEPEPYRTLDACYFWIERHFSWAKQPAFSALIVIALSLAVAFPDLRGLANWCPDWADQAHEWKLRHPLSAIPVEQFASGGPEIAGVVRHLRKHTYRITLPLIAYCLGLDLRE